MRNFKSLLFIMLAAVATVRAQQTVPPFATPYGNFTTGIKLQGSYGTSGFCPLSTGTGTHWAACPIGITQLTGDVTAGPGSGSLVATLATINSSPGTCGDATHTCQVTTNGKGLVTNQSAIALTGGITQLTGDGTAGPGTGSQAITFATVNGSPGTCGDATHVCQSTTNAKGLTTNQTQVAITTGINQLTGDVTAGPGSGSQATTLATVNGTPGTCGDATHVCQSTTNAKGLTTNQSAVSISLPTETSNVNGSYVKFGGGTIIASGTCTLSYTGTSVATCSITFPNTGGDAFGSTPNLTAGQLESPSGNNDAQGAYFRSVSTSGATGVSRCAVNIGGSGCPSSMTTTVPLSWIAFGHT